MRCTVPMAALSLLVLVAACSGDPAPTVTDPPITESPAADPDAAEPEREPREIGFGCDSSELADALSPVLRGSGYRTDLDEATPDRLVCSWEGQWQGNDELITLDVEAVDPVSSPRMTRAELLADGRQPIEDRRLDALGAEGAGLVTEFDAGDVTVYLTVAIVTSDDFMARVSLTERAGGNDQRVGDAAIRTIELVSG